MPLIVDNTIAHAVPDAADRARRRHRRALGHQVPRRPRHRDRRHHRRLRQVRLGRARRAYPGLDHARTRPTTASNYGDRSARRPTCSRPACSCCATSARRSPRSTLPARAGHRDAVAADGAARAERAGGSPSGWRRATRWRRCYYAGLASSPWHAAGSRSTLPRGRRRGGGVRASRAASRPGKQVRRRAGAAQPRGQHRRRPQPGDPPGEHDPQPALRRGAADHRCHAGPGAAGGRAWRGSRTSWPTSRRASAPPRALERRRGRAREVTIRRSIPGSRDERQRGPVTAATELPPATGAWREGTIPDAVSGSSCPAAALEAAASCPASGSRTRRGARSRGRRRTPCWSQHALTGDSHVVGPAGPGHPTAGLVGRR